MTAPTATYTHRSLSKHFDIAQYPHTHHTTNGKTTGPSQYVVDAGCVDRDMPSTGNNTQLSQLRAQLTTLQDDLNEYLTQRMQSGESVGGLDGLDGLDALDDPDPSDAE